MSIHDMEAAAEHMLRTGNFAEGISVNEVVRYLRDERDALRADLDRARGLLEEVTGALEPRIYNGETEQNDICTRARAFLAAGGEGTP